MQIYKNIFPANKREKARKIRKDMRKKKRFFYNFISFFSFFRVRSRLFAGKYSYFQ